MSSANSPCAACKFRRQKCTQECVFAPYFPADRPQKFVHVHKVFGACNVSKLLNDLSVEQREIAVNSLVYEAEHRLRDPVYGCIGLISVLRHKLDQVQTDLVNAKKELAAFVGPSALFPILQHGGATYNHPQPPAAADPASVFPFNVSVPPVLTRAGTVASHNGGAGTAMMIPDPQQFHQMHQMMETQEPTALVTAREQQELMRRYEQQLGMASPENGFMSFNGAAGFEPGSNGYRLMASAAGMSPSLAPYEQGPYQIQQLQLHEQTHPLGSLQFQSPLMQEQPPQPQAAQQVQRSSIEDGNGVELEPSY